MSNQNSCIYHRRTSHQPQLYHIKLYSNIIRQNKSFKKHYMILRTWSKKKKTTTWYRGHDQKACIIWEVPVQSVRPAVNMFINSPLHFWPVDYTAYTFVEIKCLGEPIVKMIRVFKRLRSSLFQDPRFGKIPRTGSHRGWHNLHARNWFLWTQMHLMHVLAGAL